VGSITVDMPSERPSCTHLSCKFCYNENAI